MKPPCIGPHFALIETLAFLLAIATIATLAFLIVNKTSAELRTYSRVLLCNSIVDSAFSAASFLLQLVSGLTTKIRNMVGECPPKKGLRTEKI